MKTLTVFRGANGQWYIHIRAKNGRIIADGGEGYASRSNAIRAARNNWKDGYTLTWRDLDSFNMEPKA